MSEENTATLEQPTAAPAAPAPPVTPPAAPETPPILGSDLKFSENWHTQLGDDFAPHAASLAKFKDLHGLAKSYIHAQTMGIKYPGPDADADAIIRFRQVAGVPDDPSIEAYGITLPEGSSEEDSSMYGRIAKAAHEAHIPPAALQKLISEFQSLESEKLQQFQDQQAAQVQAARDTLVKEWRGNYEQNASQVRHITGKLAEQAGIEPAELGEYLNNPAFAKLMLGVAKLTSEDGLRPPANLGDLRSPAARAQDIMAGKDPVWGEKYRSGNDEEKREAFKAVAKLLEQAEQ
jgi:hypothetical protein